MSNVEFIYLKRRIANAATMVLSGLATIFGLFFLTWILWTTLSKGIDAIGPHLFTQMTPPPGEVSGGMLNALVGSFMMCLLAVLLAAPIGIAAGTYLAEYVNHHWLGDTIRFVNDILLSAPSIVLGLFVFTILVQPTGGFSGYAGAIVPDLLVEEAGELSKICAAEDFSLVQLVTPTTPRERQVRIAQSSSGFLYYVSVTGITGERVALPEDLVDNVKWLRGQTELPICIGFGISGPETAAQLAPVADGLIVGSAVVRRVHDAGDSDTAVTQVTAFVKALRHAIDNASAEIE
jgi:hypothetical protein